VQSTNLGIVISKYCASCEEETGGAECAESKSVETGFRSSK
jgi:hypothetical protein